MVFPSQWPLIVLRFSYRFRNLGNCKSKHIRVVADWRILAKIVCFQTSYFPVSIILQYIFWWKKMFGETAVIFYSPKGCCVLIQYVVRIEETLPDMFSPFFVFLAASCREDQNYCTEDLWGKWHWTTARSWVENHSIYQTGIPTGILCLG